MKPLYIPLILLVIPLSGLAVDSDGDGSDAVEEALAGTSDNDPDQRPYWWKTFSGNSANDSFGSSVSGAGDVNNDGYDDFIVGGYGEDSNGVDSGSARVYSGIDASILYVFNGEGANDWFGASASAAGDVDGDGYADLIIGASRDDSGSIRVFSGQDGSVLYSKSGGYSNEYFGDSVSGGGDLNEDGYDDFIVGDYKSDEGDFYSGEVKVFSGLNGSVLLSLVGEDSYDYFGCSVSHVGDVNGDGYSDVVVGAFNNEEGGGSSGSAYVFSGVDGNELYKFNGVGGESFGFSVSGAGDVNNDGRDDFVIGSFNYGFARVYSGVDGAELYEFRVVDESSHFGVSVSAAGDVNGDGYDDVIIGAYQEDSNGENSGSAYVFSGVDGAMLYVFKGDGAGDLFGGEVSGVGDLDHDGYDDLIVSAVHDNNNGSRSGSARVFLASDLMNDPDLDFIVNSADLDDDNDEMPDEWEIFYGLNPVVDDASKDFDGDGATNLQEYQHGFSPLVIDNDPDFDTVNNLVDNCPDVANVDQIDSDGDKAGNACDDDDDDDGWSDVDEVLCGGTRRSDPNDHPQDTDGDGQCNYLDFDDDGDTVPDVVDADPIDNANSNEVSLDLNQGYQGMFIKN